MPTVATHVWRPSIARRVILDGFVPVPRGVIPAAPLALVWPAKDPGDVLDYELDIGAALRGNRGDSITTIDVVSTPGNPGDLVVDSVTADGETVVLWLAAGQTGTIYSVQITIGTSNGRTINRAVLLPVQALAMPSIPAAVLTTTSGAVVTDQNGNPILIGS
jgi:ribosomal protein S28E/S33